MKNTIGTNIELTIFGESHGGAIGAILDGLPAGFEIDMDRLNADMDKRKAKGALSTKRHEPDKVHFLSGFFEGKTTGTPICLLIENTNTRSQDYAQLKNRLRPGHADFSAFEKYHGFQDYRGGGHFSGRLTAPVVAAGSICRQILEAKGVFIGTHIARLQDIEDVPFATERDTILEQIQYLNSQDFPALDESKGQEMKNRIEAAMMDLDSVGGILQTNVVGYPAGVGEPFFDSIESVLSHLLFSIPAIKGVSFGEGFGFADLYGSQANDPLHSDGQSIVTTTNRNGGINGGISNGMPIVFQCVVKPTASIYKKQNSVDYSTKENVELEIKGRHDPAIIHRARAVVDAMSAFGLLDLWMSHEAVEAFEEHPYRQEDSACR